jgi:GT2 family glycosyltransferase
VDLGGYTNSFSTCNLAFRKSAFNDLGRFDESFPVPGGEDTILARKTVASGRRIRYCPGQLVYHVEKKTLHAFIRWQITRGRGNYYIKQHAGRVGGYLWLRVWTFKNSLMAAGPRYAPLVLGLIVLSVYYQTKGYRLEKRKTCRST